MSLEEKLEQHEIDVRLVVNSHVHLPQSLTVDRLMSRPADHHTLLPLDILKNTLPLIKISNFLRQTSAAQGMSVLLPVERHNIHGEESLLYCSNQHVLQLAQTHPDQFVPFGSLDLSADDAPIHVEKLADAGILGIKYHAVEGYPLVREGKVTPNVADTFEVMQQRNLPLTVHLGDTPFPGVDLENARPTMLIPIAKAFPKLRLMITHFATPLHLEAFWVASCFDNVFYDTAEYPLYWTANRLNPYGPLLSPLHTQRIGSHKIVYGTDFPMPTLTLRHGKIELEVHRLSYYLEKFLDLPRSYFSTTEKRQILCENVFHYLGRSREEIIQNNSSIRMDGA